MQFPGTGIGTLIFPPITQYMLDHYGFRGSILILGGVILNLCVCGALLRPLAFYQVQVVCMYVCVFVCVCL